MNTYHVRLLGVPTVEGQQGIVPIRGSKTLALLFYLAAHPNTVVSRAHVAALLWENDDELVGRNSLNTTLSRLRAMLPVWPLITDRQTLCWTTQSDYAVDIHSFTQWMKGTTARGESNWDAVHERQQRIRAIDLWHGEFLTDFHLSGHNLFADWMRDQRLIWNGRALRVLTELVRLDEEVGDWQALERHARLGIRIDSFQESLHRAIMLALFQQGDRAAALAHFESVRRLLAVELGIEPEAKTVLLRQVVAQQTVLPAIAEPRRAVPSFGVYHLPESAGHAGTPPLVGRVRELKELWSAMPVQNQKGYRMVLVQGEIGIGKSRLVREIEASLRRWQAPEVSLLVAACHDGIDSHPGAVLIPLHNATQRLLQQQQRAETTGPQVLSGPLPAIKEALLTGLLALRAPVVLVLEDIHWAGETSLAALADLVRHLPPSITLLTTCRQSVLSSASDYLLRQLQQEGLLHWTALTPLAREAIDELAVSMDAATPAMAEWLWAQSQGVPLFAVELLRTKAGSGHWDLTDADRPLRSTAVSSFVQAAVLAQCERLSPGARELAGAASMFANGASLAVLRQMVGQSENQAMAECDELLRCGLMAEAPGTDEVRFRYDLVRVVVQRSMSHARQQTLRRRVAQLAAKADGTDAKERPLMRY